MRGCSAASGRYAELHEMHGSSTTSPCGQNLDNLALGARHPCGQNLKQLGSGARRKVFIKPFMAQNLCACRPSLQSGGQGLQQQKQASRLSRA